MHRATPLLMLCVRSVILFIIFYISSSNYLFLINLVLSYLTILCLDKSCPGLAWPVLSCLSVRAVTFTSTHFSISFSFASSTVLVSSTLPLLIYFLSPLVTSLSRLSPLLLLLPLPFLSSILSTVSLLTASLHYVSLSVAIFMIRYFSVLF